MWQKGQSGNPDGRKHEKVWRAALDRAVIQDDGKRVRAAAEKLLDLAASGEPWAVKELGDRLDGKAVQPVEAEVDATLTVNLVQFGSNNT